MRIAVAVPEPHVTAPVLDAALEGVTRLDEELLRAGTVPPFRQMADRVRWKPEPPGGEHFDHAGIVARRGWGDCDDLAPWHAASLRVTGEDPDAEAFARRSGAKRWHCLVRRSDGTIDDPSIEAGMPAPGAAVGIRGAALPPMFRQSHSLVSGAYQAIPHLALRPVADRHGMPEAWQARTDLPWHVEPGNSPADVAMVSLHQSPISDQALVGACRGAIRLGEASDFAKDADLDRLQALCDGCDGASWEELAREYGPEHADAVEGIIGSWFGKLTRGISRSIKHPGRLVSMATRALPTVTSFVPGVGPVASMAMRAASPALQHLVRRGAHKNPKRRKHMHLTSPPLYSRADVLHAWDAWS